MKACQDYEALVYQFFRIFKLSYQWSGVAENYHLKQDAKVHYLNLNGSKIAQEQGCANINQPYVCKHKWLKQVCA